jgi:hypothetical protein
MSASAYEIRLQILELAFAVAATGGDGREVTAKEIIGIAKELNVFVSDNKQETNKV